MLHLFNKVYLEFDDNIEINFDRVVISERYGVGMYQALDKVSYGALLAHSKTYEEIVAGDFSGFISSLKSFGETSGKKVIVYCDKDAYKKFIAQWFKNILPSLDYKSFKNIVDYTVYNQRMVSNTQLSSVYSVDLNSLWDGLSSVKKVWEEAAIVDSELIKNLNLNYSYEFLLASYLSDSSKKEELKKTIHMFLRRWFKELLNDNRQMVLLNITNHKFLSSMSIDPKLVDITQLDPLANIPQLQSYADDEIWERDQNKYGVCKLEGLSDEKATGLKTLLLSVYANFEGMQIDQSVFSFLDYITCATKEEITDDQLEQILSQVTNDPFDTCLIPRFDFQNVNFPLLQYFLSQKFNGKDLSKYSLL